MASALAGDEVFVYPGVYLENVIIPTDVSLRGANALNTIIRVVNPAVPLPVVTLNVNCRFEDMSVELNLDSPSNIGPYDILLVASGASESAKIRGCTINGTLLSGSAIINGLHSPGISPLISIKANQILRASQIKIIGTGTSPIRAILVDGPNSISCNTSILYAEGTGTNIVACEVDNADAILNLKTSTVSGKTYDLLRTNGIILIGACDLINHTAPLSFAVDIQPNHYFFGILGFPGGNITYYLPPSIIPVASISTTTPYVFTFLESLVLFAIQINYSGTIDPGDSMTLTVFKNNVATLLTLTLTSVSLGEASLRTVGLTILPTDFIDVRLIIVGTPNTGNFTCKILTY